MARKRVFNPEAYDPPWGDFPHDPKAEPLPSTLPNDKWVTYLIWALLICGILFVGMAWIVTAALARDPDGRYANSALKGWFDSLKSKDGISCCADFDGHPPEAVWETEDGYKVQIEGQWVNVPPDALLNTPNKYGKAVVWYWTETGQDNVKIFHVRCFLAGALG